MKLPTTPSVFSDTHRSDFPQSETEKKHEIVNWYWSPQQDIIDHLVRYCTRTRKKKILEIGPGNTPFPLSTHFVDLHPSQPNCVKIDLDQERLPYEDKEFDFVYCRHVLEDIQNPDFVAREIHRVGKSCFIETPSPMVEMLHRVDSGTPSYRGYIHHRYFVYSENKQDYCTLYFLPKYPIVEHMSIQSATENNWISLVNACPFYWNNYYFWEGGDINKKFEIKVLKNEVDFALRNLVSYAKEINTAVLSGFSNTNAFLEKIKREMD